MSWDILERNSDFASLARLASSTASMRYFFPPFFPHLITRITSRTCLAVPSSALDWTINLARCQLLSVAR